MKLPKQLDFFSMNGSFMSRLWLLGQMGAWWCWRSHSSQIPGYGSTGHWAG